MSEINTALSAPVERKLFTVSQFAQRHPFVTQGALRFQIFQRENNGLQASGAIVRIGRKILIDEAKYFKWLDTQSGKGGEKR